MTVTVGYQQSTTYPAAVDRGILLANDSMDGGLGLNTSVRPGVMFAPDGSMFEASAAAPMAITIAPGVANITPGYRLVSDAPVSVPIQPVGASARTDLIVARVYDTEAGDAQSQGTIEVITGTSASLPPTPARALNLCSIAWPANATQGTQGTIADRRSFTAASGGVIRWGAAKGAVNMTRLAFGQVFYDSVQDQLYYLKSNKSVYPVGFEVIGQYHLTGEAPASTQGPGTTLDPVVYTASGCPAGQWGQLLASIQVAPATGGQTIAGYTEVYIAGHGRGQWRFHNMGAAGTIVQTMSGIWPSPPANPELRIRITSDSGSGNVKNYAWTLEYYVYGR